MFPTVENSPEFQALLRGDAGVDLALVALEIAGDAYPSLVPRAALHRIERLADSVTERLPVEPEAWLTIEAVNTVLFRENGLHGNTTDYYDPRNSYLNDVLERKTGIPISLGLIYMAVASRAGLEVRGVNLPAHFVLRVDVEGESLFIDPFHGGCLLDRAGLRELVRRMTGQALSLGDTQLAACAPDVIVRRLLYNLKLIHLRARRMEAAIPVLKRLTLLNRDVPGELRDLGIACFYGERRHESFGYLEEYLRQSPYADDADEIRLLLRSTDS